MSTKPEVKKRSHHRKPAPVAKPVNQFPHPGTPLGYQPRNIQQTFRTTPDEHKQLCKMAEESGHGKLAKFYRSRMGLPA